MELISVKDLEQASSIFQGKTGNAFARAILKLCAVDKINTLYTNNEQFTGGEFASHILEDIKAEEKGEILLILNELNQNKRWGKFYLEENGSVSLLASLLSSKCEIDSADVYELAVMVKATVDSLKSKFS